MPIKPHKGESQDDFMARCMHELGQSDTERPQDQKVAICMSAWRDKSVCARQKYAATVDPPDPDETREQFMDRCTMEMSDTDPEMDDDDIMDACSDMWDEEGEERAARSARGPVKPVLHKTHSSTVQGYEFIMSDDTPDRMGDIISSEGWDIANFKRNPVALWNHSPMHPIGKWDNLRVEKGALRGHLHLAPKGISARIDEIRALIDAGILQAVSVGFRPIESKPIPEAEDKKKGFFGGEHYLRQELIEVSLVSVPANPNALAVAKALNISSETQELVFRQARQSGDKTMRKGFTAKHGDDISREGKGSAMSLAQRITDLQTYINNKTAELDAHLASQDDSNVKETDLQKTNDLNAQLKQARNQHAALVEAEKNIAGTAVSNGNGSGNGDGRSRALATTGAHAAAHDEIGAPIIIKRKKDWEPLDYIVHAGVAMVMAKSWGVPAEVALLKIYGDDEPHKVVFDWVTRAASAPAMTTVTGWAAELVQQTYASPMELLFAKSILPRLAAKGLGLNFGRFGKIVLPTRSRTPTIAGSFVGEGAAIPVRQGAFTSQTFVPKKLAVISVWTREMNDHSIPGIEGVLRDAIQNDTAIAVDSILLDANAATTVRPPGILNGVGATTATAGGGVAAVVGDIKSLVGALVTATYGNVRAPVWLMNPVDMLSASLVTAANTGIFPFRDEIANGRLANIPIIDSASVTAKTVILIDAADFVTMDGGAVRMELNDTATLHMEDTNPLDLVSGSPGTVASPQRSLFQTDSIALRMITSLNWGIRRSGVVSWTQNVTW